MGSLPKNLKQIEQVDGRTGADTIRLWEHYRDHAYMWRSLALWQFPCTMVAIGAAMMMFFMADTVIEVPEKPQPGHYSVKQLPDAEFIDVATKVVNAITTYQPHNAREQFYSARKFLWEPALSEFEDAMVRRELRVVEETARSQIFFIDTKQIKIERHADLDKVVVRLPGVRQKLLAQKPLPPDEMVYYIKMTTIPRNVHNEYGIVVVDIRLRVAPLAEIAAEDRQEKLEQEREEAKQKKLQKRTGAAPAAPEAQAPTN
jgi:hypothetical protein